MKDTFPGYEEDTRWKNEWVCGIGSLSYSAGAPGFVRLLLDGPGIAGTYHNAEKKHYNKKSAGFLYCDVEIRLRNSNNNGWDAPDIPDPAYGLGSRGWGFWNDQMDLSSANIIWFSSISPDSADALQGTQIWIVKNGKPVIIQNINIDLTKWHTYRIQWRSNYIGLFIDDVENPVAEVTDPASIPDQPLSFTAWIDNHLVEGDFYNLELGALAVPDIDQYIDIDYVHIYKF